MLTVKKRLKKSSEITKLEKEFYYRINSNLIKRVEGKIHTNITLDSHITPATSSFVLDCIGKNGTLIGGAKSLSFTQTKETLQKKQLITI